MPSTSGPAGPFLRPQDLGIGRLFDAIRDAVVVSDAEGRILLWNEGAASIFGYRPDEVLGRSVSMLVPERLRAQHEQGMARYAATGHGPLIDTHTPVELPALRKGGEEIWIELTLSPIDEPGRRFALALMRDVTERVRLRSEVERRNRDLQRSNESLSQVNESLTAFTYVVSHDLKEPVRAIDTYLRVLQEDHARELPDDGQEVLTRALLATERLSALLRGLLDLSRVDRPHLLSQSVTLKDVLESEACRAAYEDLLHERHGAVELDPCLPAVRGPPAVLCQVLGNLMTNALKHNTSPHPRVRITAGAQPDGLVEVRVEDNGPGFPPELVRRFNQGEDGPRAGALHSGFGLLIARRAVERMGGRLWLAASPTLGGASVHFTIPAGT